MTDEPEDEYFLGSGDDDEPADDHRNRRGALIGLAVVAVLVAVTIALTSLFVDTSPTPRGPSTAAQRWSEALAKGDTAARRRLECPEGSASADAVALVVTIGTRASAGTAERTGPGRWSVPLRIDGAGRTVADPVPVTVVRRSGRYLVC